MRLVGLSGSFRRGSWNTRALEHIGGLLPSDVAYEVFDRLDQVPFYADELERAVPAEAARLREAVGDADGIIIATPEYNHSYTPVIKNAIDWLSRPVGRGALSGKAVALLGVAPGLFGTVRAQAHLRQVLHGTNSVVLARPEVFINEAERRFDAEGRLVDPTASALVAELVDALLALVGRHGATRGEAVA